MIGDFIFNVVASWLGGLLARRRGWRLPRAVWRPDGSVTLPGLAHGFDVPSYAAHRGWIGGHVTIAPDVITHSIDADGKLSRRTIPLRDAAVTIRPPTDEEFPSVLNRTVVCISLPDGRPFKIAIDPAYDRVLQLFRVPRE
ncbi:hypothetical protein Pth03_30710 [Planotetraspora thailandica]|uniref:Uncharacterized protein n=1 Tax=Planotetraspora thailandica TaxID=487172 RepID=A0A8J3XTT2_9ACTN|nr:hypothetical protein [Planotetraspora thailandica]GII54682.1 hypothetical protein Pth03_30710 [Planotetraspora thailandica]